MPKRQSITVGPTAVREWAESQDEFKGAKFVTRTDDNGFPRGRLPLAAIEAYQTATGNTYDAGHREVEAVTLTVTKRDSKGRKRSRKVEKTRAEVLVLAGKAENHKGVLSRQTIADAEAALSDPEPEAVEA